MLQHLRDERHLVAVVGVSGRETEEFSLNLAPSAGLIHNQIFQNQTDQQVAIPGIVPRALMQDMTAEYGKVFPGNQFRQGFTDAHDRESVGGFHSRR
ncbi:hypothetical protein [Maricaulis sp. MIT060901]|uniref:hypothetical protein n=1 Tax=Maricaulis sp. MIT060901 TaxID=3096993 RepID=UPI00399A6C12